MVAVAEHSPVVRFGRLESRGVLLGLSMPQLALVGVGVLILVVAQYAGGTAAAVLAAPVWALPLVVALVPWRGRPLLMWIPVLGGWATRRVSGSTSQRTPLAKGAGGLVVPGIRRLSLAGSASGVGLVRDATDSSVTTVLRVDGTSLLLDGAGEQKALVDGWGSTLASLAQTSGLLRVQVLHRSVPGGSTALREWWTERSDAAPWASVVTDLLSTSLADTLRPETLIAVRWKSRSRGVGARGIADGIDRQTDALVQGLRSAGVRVIGWAGEAELARLLRRSFEPGSSGANVVSEPSAKPPVAGMALQESWDHVRTDSAVHAVYWVREWPRSDAHVSFLHPLLNGSGRRTLSLTIEPVPLGRAMRDIRRAKVEHAADEARNARWGRVGVESERAESEDVVRRERELVAGHADLRFVGLLTVSADDLDALAAACAATETAAAQAMCEIRRLAGQQSAAWLAGALPLARSVS